MPAVLAPLARADASEGELAYANFAIAAEFLMADYYARLLKAGLVHGSANGATVARRNEGEHVPALATLLSDAGQGVRSPRISHSPGRGRRSKHSVRRRLPA